MMTTAKKTDRIVIAVLILIAALMIGSIVHGHVQPKDGGNAANEHAGETVTYRDYNGKKIGILSGTFLEGVTFEHFPDSEYYYYNTYTDLNAALTGGKIDAYLGDEPALKRIHALQPQIDYIRERLTKNEYSFAFRKNDADEKKLLDEFNTWLAGIKADGTHAEIEAIWFGKDETKKVVDMSGLTGENGTIHVVTTSTDEPFSYIKDGKHVGYDIDVAVRFCRDRGYRIEITDVNYDARIPALASGKYEFTTTMNVTPEREEEVLFSEPVSEGGIVTAVRSEDLPQNDELTIDDFDGRTIGTAAGTTFDQSIKDNIDDANVVYFRSYGDMLAALETGKIDAFCTDEPVARSMMIENKKVAVIPQLLELYDYAYAFPKTAEGKKLCDQFSEFVHKRKADGTIAEIDGKWFSDDEQAKTAPDYGRLSGENGMLILAGDFGNPPFATLIGDQYAGYEMDLAFQFCLDYGYGLEIRNYNFDAVLPSVQSGVCDFACSCITVTPERAESVYFSDPHYVGGAVLVVRAEDLKQTAAEEEPQDSFFSSLKNSFEKTFIRENRWRLILSGMGVTCLITVMSVLLGSLLAFGICMLRRTGSTVANWILDVYVKIMQGTPMVVLLMILYYIVFGKSGIDAIWVAVIAFGLNMGAYGSEIMRAGIQGVDSGQMEAALALGFTPRQAFFDFVYPQAAVLFLPVYRGEIVSLLKSTSIVGYVAVMDLTKMSDIIRSRTYDAFFPLLTTALIYFALAWQIAAGINALLRRVDWKQGRKQNERKVSG